jgi:hypothetical protein
VFPLGCGLHTGKPEKFKTKNEKDPFKHPKEKIGFSVEVPEEY